MADFITGTPKLATDGRYVNQGLLDPEAAETGELTSENARIIQTQTNTEPLKFDGKVGLDAPYTGNDLPQDRFTELGAVSTDSGLTGE